MEEIKIITDNDIAQIYTPYNKEFVNRIHNIGGSKWKNGCWNVPSNTIGEVREILKDIFGYTDLEENDTVDLRVIFSESEEAICTSIALFGKTLAHAFSRDSGAKVGDDVSLVSGGISSGGSAVNWKSIVEEGSVFVLHNVNRNVFDKELPNVPEYIKVEVEEVEENNKRKKVKLLARRKEILLELKRINEELEKL